MAEVQDWKYLSSNYNKLSRGIMETYLKFYIVKNSVVYNQDLPYKIKVSGEIPKGDFLS